MNKLLELVKEKLGCGYVWGSQGETLTPQLLKQFMNDLGKEHYVLSDGTRADKWLGKQCFDCSGLVVWALIKLGMISSDSDYSAGMLFYSLCTPIEFQEMKPGDLVFRKNAAGEIVHVGIYAGNGDTIEAKGTAFGVVKGRAIDFNMFGKLKFDLNSYGDVVQGLINKGAIKDPAYWENNLVPGGTVKADYVIIVLKKLLGIPG
jgi:cell wall-associated NlpC family hydrolase